MTGFSRFQAHCIGSAITATILVVGTYIVRRSMNRSRVPEEWVEVGTLEKIYLYPLKSGHRIELKQAECTDVGIKEPEKFDKSFQLMDRSFVVYSPKDNEFKTARTYPKLLQIEVETTDINYVTINAPNMRTLFVKIPNRQDNEVRDIVQFSGEKINSIDCGDEAGQWLSQYLLDKEEGMRLCFNDGQIRRDIKRVYKEFTKHYKNFDNNAAGLHSDLAAMLVINQASVDDLNQRLSKDDQITELNFRPNFLVTGTNLKPYEEDNWNYIKIGDVIVQNAVDCGRCVMTTINQDTTVRNKSMEPLKTLKTYRVLDGPQKSPIMGAFLKLITPGMVRTGDKIYLGKN